MADVDWIMLQEKAYRFLIYDYVYLFLVNGERIAVLALVFTISALTGTSSAARQRLLLA